MATLKVYVTPSFDSAFLLVKGYDDDVDTFYFCYGDVNEQSITDGSIDTTKPYRFLNKTAMSEGPKKSGNYNAIIGTSESVDPVETCEVYKIPDVYYETIKAAVDEAYRSSSGSRDIIKAIENTLSITFYDSYDDDDVCSVFQSGKYDETESPIASYNVNYSADNEKKQNWAAWGFLDNDKISPNGTKLDLWYPVDDNNDNNATGTYLLNAKGDPIYIPTVDGSRTGFATWYRIGFDSTYTYGDDETLCGSENNCLYLYDKSKGKSSIKTVLDLLGWNEDTWANITDVDCDISEEDAIVLTFKKDSELNIDGYYKVSTDEIGFGSFNNIVTFTCSYATDEDNDNLFGIYIETDEKNSGTTYWFDNDSDYAKINFLNATKVYFYVNKERLTETDEFYALTFAKTAMI